MRQTEQFQALAAMNDVFV